MRLGVALLALVCASVVGAAPSTRPGCAPKLKEEVIPPHRWNKVGSAPADHKIELRIGLVQSNFPLLEQHLYEVSDPFHERYGQHLTKEQVDALVAPPEESIQLVDEWLASHGIYEDDFTRSSAGDWITVKVPVSLAEEMLNTEYHVFTHSKTGESLVRTTAYSLPENLHGHIDVVQPTTHFTGVKALKSTLRFSENQHPVIDTSAPPIKVPSASGGQVDASCNETITITCLLELYNAVGFNASATNGNQIAITGYLEQYANREDLQSFYALQRPEALGTTFKFVSVNGGLDNQSLADAGDEADLDVEFAFGLSFPTPSTFFSTAGSPPFIPDEGDPTDTNEPYTKWLDFVLSQPTLPQTISTSYGDDEQTVPLSFAQRVCNEFAQLGARGVSLTFSSGDGGVGDGDPDPATQECITNDGRNATRFIPGFPASCPFVTAVGGTIFIPEVAVPFSGGGFSNYFSRPSYQDAAVDQFLGGLAPGTYAGLFNPNGRAIPDISAEADLFQVVIGNETGLIGGTSASSPTVAGFVSLLNSARISAGQSPLGFLNPLIYAILAKEPTAFNDITEGNNPGCGTEGFNATIGWDAITGVGTPNFGKLKEIVTTNSLHIPGLR